MNISLRLVAILSDAAGTRAEFQPLPRVEDRIEGYLIIYGQPTKAYSRPAIDIAGVVYSLGDVIEITLPASGYRLGLSHPG